MILIRHNRVEYTKLALASVLGEPTEQFNLTIWDQETLRDQWLWRRQALDYLLDDPRDVRYYWARRKRLRGLRPVGGIDAKRRKRCLVAGLPSGR